MKCQNCGADLMPGAKFCGHCGTPAVQPAEPAEELTAAAEAVEETADQALDNAEAAVEETAESIEQNVDEYALNFEQTVSELPDEQSLEEEIALPENAHDMFPEEPVTVALGDTPVPDEITVPENAPETEIPVEPVVPAVEEVKESKKDKKKREKEEKKAQKENKEKTEKVDKHPDRPYFRRGALAHFFTVLIAIILFVALTLTVVVGVLQFSISEKAATEALMNIDLASMKVRDLLNEDQLRDLGFKLDPDSESIIDFIYDNIDQSRLSEPISRSEFEEIADSDDFREFVGLTISKSAADIVGNIQTNIIDIDQIEKFLKKKDTLKLLSKTLNTDITDDEIDEFIEMLKDKFGSAIEELQVQKIDKAVGKEAASIIKLVFETWVLIVLGAVTLLLTVLIFLVIHSWRLGLRYNAVVYLIVGVPCLLCGLLLPTVTKAVLNVFGVAEGLVAVLVPILSAFSKVFIIIGAGVAGLGFAMLIASIVVGVIQRVKYKKSMEANA